jgi:hypothetical protein
VPLISCEYVACAAAYHSHVILCQYVLFNRHGQHVTNTTWNDAVWQYPQGQVSHSAAVDKTCYHAVQLWRLSFCVC